MAYRQNEPEKIFERYEGQMKKVVAVVGSPRIGETYKAVRRFEEKLKEHGDVDFEYVVLKDKNVSPCKGCLACIMKGEAYCPQKDDTVEIFEKMMKADGVLFATPVYSLQVSALLKILLERLAYVFHRPCFFGKAFMPIAVHAIVGSKEVNAYLNNLAGFWGFTTTEGLGLDTPPVDRTPKAEAALDVKIENAAASFYQSLYADKTKSPGWKDFMMFRMSRSVKPYIKVLWKDYEYYREKGWMDSDYYYPVKLGPIRKLSGKFFDSMGRRYGEKLQKENLQPRNS